MIHIKVIAAASIPSLLEGLKHDGELRKFNQNRNHSNCGLHITFCAPKSVSVAALVGGDTRLIKAHKAAVDYAVEGIIAVLSDGGNRDINIILLCEHTKDRAGEVHLHSHALLDNVPYMPAAQYVAMKSIGNTYQAELLCIAKELGYTIEFENKKGK